MTAAFRPAWVLGALDSAGADGLGLGGDAFDGESLLPVWQVGGEDAGERTLYWEHVGNAAIRRGDFKLVRQWGGPWELYDIASDRIESVDLAESYPGLVAELASEYEGWARAHDVIPWQDVLDDYAARGIHPMRAMG